jgi:hypothetical protein
MQTRCRNSRDQGIGNREQGTENQNHPTKFCAPYFPFFSAERVGNQRTPPPSVGTGGGDIHFHFNGCFDVKTFFLQYQGYMTASIRDAMKNRRRS